MIFEEARAHLGVETQRQWSKRAIARTTPILLALFSVVTLIAHRLVTTQTLPVRTSAWYHKLQPTFSDALAWVRYHLWGSDIFSTSPAKIEGKKISDPALVRLIEVLCYAA